MDQRTNGPDHASAGNKLVGLAGRPAEGGDRDVISIVGLDLVAAGRGQIDLRLQHIQLVLVPAP